MATTILGYEVSPLYEPFNRDATHSPLALQSIHLRLDLSSASEERMDAPYNISSVEDDECVFCVNQDH